MNQYLVLIILLNFLIAIISQSYDEVMSNEMKTKYEQRCELTWKCTLLIEQGQDMKNFFTCQRQSPTSNYVFTLSTSAASLEENE